MARIPGIRSARAGQFHHLTGNGDLIHSESAPERRVRAWLTDSQPEASIQLARAGNDMIGPNPIAVHSWEDNRA